VVASAGSFRSTGGVGKDFCSELFRVVFGGNRRKDALALSTGAAVVVGTRR